MLYFDDEFGTSVRFALTHQLPVAQVFFCYIHRSSNTQYTFHTYFHWFVDSVRRADRFILFSPHLCAALLQYTISTRIWRQNDHRRRRRSTVFSFLALRYSFLVIIPVESSAPSLLFPCFTQTFLVVALHISTFYQQLYPTSLLSGFDMCCIYIYTFFVMVFVANTSSPSTLVRVGRKPGDVR